MTFLVKMASQGEGGRDWGSFDGLMWRSLKMGPVSPEPESDDPEFVRPGTWRRSDDLDHRNVPAEG